MSVQDPDSRSRRSGSDSFDLLISDINLNAPRSGLDLLRRFKADRAGPVVLISGFGTLETAIEAVRAGAFDYISKPFVIADVKRIVERALEQGTRRGRAAAEMPASPVGSLIGRTAPMLEVYKQIAHAADSSAPVLIVGESGVGKGARRPGRFTATASGRASRLSASIAARLPIRCSSRSCSAISAGRSRVPSPTTRASSSRRAVAPCSSTRLATRRRRCRSGSCGSWRKARSDRSAASRSVRVAARVIAATNVPLEQAVADGRFRQDLYYRLSVIVIRVPPLRERRADIPLLIGSFLEDACKRAGQRKELSTDALDTLLRHTWPGNVRELETRSSAWLCRAAARSSRRSICPPVADAPPAPQDQPFADLPTLDALERRYLLHVLDAAQGNRTRAAEILGVDRRTLYRMAERFGIPLPE